MKLLYKSFTVNHTLFLHLLIVQGFGIEFIVFKLFGLLLVQEILGVDRYEYLKCVFNI